MTVEKAEALRALEAEIASDKSLPLQESNLVFGEGNPDCDVMFIGEAPGQNEDIQKRPFVGRGGQLLRQCVRDLGWKEEDVYISNIVKRRPPENRDPLPEEIAAYKPYLTRQISIIDPKVIVPLGRFSMNYFLPEGKITRDQGKAFRLRLTIVGSSTSDGVADPHKTRIIAPMFHPAAALRAPQVMEEFKKNFKKLPAIVEKGMSMPDLPEARPAATNKLPEARRQADTQIGENQAKLF